MSERIEEGLPDEEFSELMQKLGAAAPLLGGLLRPTPSGDGVGSDRSTRREALLCRRR